MPILHGAVNLAFLILRNVLEDAVDSFYADVMLGGRPFEERIKKLRAMSICKLIRRIEGIIGEDAAKKVWEESSNRLHAVVGKKGDGIIPLAAMYIERYGHPPTYQTVPLPWRYEFKDTDLDELRSLRECIALTKLAVDRILRAWHERLSGVSGGLSSWLLFGFSGVFLLCYWCCLS